MSARQSAEAPRRLPALDRVAALARGLKPIARFVCLVSTLCAAWIGYLLHGWLQLSPGWTAGSTVLVGLPALLYAWLWWLLYALGELPERVHGAVGTFKEIATREPAPRGVSGLRLLGGALRDVWRVLDETDNVMLPISAAVLLANPLGLAVLGVGFAWALLLWLAAAIAGLARLFF